MLKQIKNHLMEIIIALLFVLFTVLSFTGCTVPSLAEPVAEAPKTHILEFLGASGNVVFKMVLPPDPVLDALTSSTDWTPVAVLGEKQNYLLMVAATTNPALYVVLCVRLNEDGSIVPIALNIENVTALEGQRYARGWWYGGACALMPKLVDKEQLLKLLKIEIQGAEPDRSI